MRGKGSAGRDAISVFRTALKLDETSVAALTGQFTIRSLCFILRYQPEFAVTVS